MSLEDKVKSNDKERKSELRDYLAGNIIAGLRDGSIVILSGFATYHLSMPNQDHGAAVVMGLMTLYFAYFSLGQLTTAGIDIYRYNQSVRGSVHEG